MVAGDRSVHQQKARKRGCRRVMARVASLRKARISGNQSQTVCLNQSTRLGAFVLLGPRSPVSVRSTSHELLDLPALSWPSSPSSCG